MLDGLAEVIQQTPKVIDKVNFVWGAVVSVLMFALGDMWFLFAGFLVLNMADWITGNIKAHVWNKTSSVVGAKGILKKVWYWCVIGIAFFVSSAFSWMGVMLGINLDFVHLFGWLTLAMYLINEIRSILENIVQMDVDVPQFLIKGLDVTKKIMEDKGRPAEESESEERK